jgi:hypothetical protein
VSEGLLIWIFGIGSLIGVTVWLTGKVLMSTHDEMTTGAGGQAAPSSPEHASGLVQRDEVRGRHAPRGR